MATFACDISFRAPSQVYCWPPTYIPSVVPSFDPTMFPTFNRSFRLYHRFYQVIVQPPSTLFRHWSSIMQSSNDLRVCVSSILSSTMPSVLPSWSPTYSHLFMLFMMQSSIPQRYWICLPSVWPTFIPWPPTYILHICSNLRPIGFPELCTIVFTELFSNR